MMGSSDTVIGRARLREAAAIFSSRDELEAAVGALLWSGFDRADIDIASRDVARRKLGLDIPPEELPEVPDLPRRALFTREDLDVGVILAIGTLASVGAAIGAWLVVARGGGAAAAVATAIAGAVILGAVAVWITGLIRRRAPELDGVFAAGELILLVRVRSADQEHKAQQVLESHRAHAVRVHEVDIDKRLENLPLSSLRVDPWLGEETLAGPPAGRKPGRGRI
jgi:hypothetical protein